MKLLLLHGPAIKVSRTKLISIRKNFDPNNVVVFETGSNAQDLLGELITVPLIEEHRLMIWENPSEDLPIPTQDTPNLTLVLWFDHQIDQKKYPNAQSFFFPEEKEISVFPFLDYLANCDKKAFLEMAKLKKAGFDIFYLTTMVYYLLRNLVSTPKNVPGFVKIKLEKQRIKFALDKIKKFYKSILETEFKIKSGLLETSQAEFLLVNLFTH